MSCPRFHACLLLLSVVFSTTAALAENTLEYELDPYYSNLSYIISLTDKPVPEIESEAEIAVYDRLLDSLLTRPQFFLIEASINPLPILGTAIRRNYPERYEDAEISSDLNLVQVFTEGFEEPWALSFFLGSVVQFVSPGEDVKTSNKGYSGFLLSGGKKHIVSNLLVDDDWFEFEWKIKGDKDFAETRLSWSFRTGVKVHDNPDIADTVYFAIRRNHLDVASEDIRWYDNSDIEITIALNNDDYSAVQQSVFVNQKWPIPFIGKTAFELGIGFILEKEKYTGSLQSQAEDFRLIIRPSFEF